VQPPWTGSPGPRGRRDNRGGGRLRTLYMTAPRALPPSRRPSAGPRRRAALLVGALTALFLGLGTAPALAHDGLVSTAPLNTEVVTTPPTTVELTFTGEPLPLGTEVLVVGPDGGQVSTGAAEIRGTSVVQALSPAMAPGDYSVEWRSTSSDGHALTGALEFTVAAASTQATGSPVPAPTTAAAPATPGTATVSADADADGGMSTGWLVAGVLGLGALGSLLALGLRRRS
jgi:methionine-rich copper-binding protein CopC